LRTGFAREEDDPRGAEHRNAGNATSSPHRTMRYGFLASSSVHGDLLAHVIARANAIRQIVQYGPRVGSRQGKPAIQKICVWVSRQCRFSNDQFENRAVFKSGCEAGAISEQTIRRWRLAVCELLYISSKRFVTGMSPIGAFRIAQAPAAMSVVEVKAERGRRQSISANDPKRTSEGSPPKMHGRSDQCNLGLVKALRRLSLVT
jgi:hypothetical protein